MIRANWYPGAADPAATGRQARAARQFNVDDVAIAEDEQPIEAIVRFHAALRELTGRDGIRADPSRYEAISLALVDMRAGRAGRMLPSFPHFDSPSRLDRFFKALYRHYDERNVISAPNLAARNRRLEWSPDSPAFESDARPELDYELRWAR